MTFYAHYTNEVSALDEGLLSRLTSERRYWFETQSPIWVHACQTASRALLCLDSTTHKCYITIEANNVE